MALWGKPGAMMDACIHLPLMTFICNNDYKHKTQYSHTVLSVQATVQLHDRNL